MEDTTADELVPIDLEEEETDSGSNTNSESNTNSNSNSEINSESPLPVASTATAVPVSKTIKVAEDEKRFAMNRLKAHVIAFYNEVNAPVEQFDKVDELLKKYGGGIWNALRSVAEKKGYSLDIIAKHEAKWKEGMGKPPVTAQATPAFVVAPPSAPAPKFKKPIIKGKIPEIPEAPAAPKPVAPSAKDPTTIDEWLNLRQKQKQKWVIRQHRYTADGEILIEPATPEEREVRIPIPAYVPAKTQAIQEYFKKRYGEDIKAAEEDYTAMKRELQRMMLEYKAGRQTIQDVLGANEAVHEAECKLTMKTKTPRFLATDMDIILRELTFNIHDVSKIEKVFRGEYNTFPDEAFWTTAESAAFEEAKEAAEATTEAPVAQEGGNPKKPLSMSAIMAIRAQKAKAF